MKAEEAQPEVTPSLSSAKRKFRFWIFDPYDLIVASAWAVFAFHFLPTSVYFVGLIIIFVLIAFYKYDKPDGYFFHKVNYHIFRPKSYKPGKRRKTPVFFRPDSIKPDGRLLSKDDILREAHETESWLKARHPNTRFQ
jgi:hypothetical protein